MPQSRSRPHLDYSLTGPANAPALVFVNGLGGLKESWIGQVHHFWKTYRVLTYNQRGVGGSEVVDADVTTGDFAGDLLRLLDELEMKVVHLVGISFGGRVAMEFALHWPERLARLVVVGSSGGASLYIPGSIAAVAALRRAPTLSAEEWNVALIPYLFGPRYRQEHADQLLRLARWWARHPQHPMGMARQWQAWDSFNRSHELALISVPTLLIHGTADALSPPQNSRYLAATIPGARLCLLEGSGHSPNVEDMGGFNGALEDFLATESSVSYGPG